MPATPSNGARISFLSMTDCMLSTAALRCVYLAAAASNSAFEMTLRFGQIARAVEVGFRQFRVGLRGTQLRLLGRRVQSSPADRPSSPASGFKSDLAHRAGQLGADGRALHRADRTDRGQALAPNRPFAPSHSSPWSAAAPSLLPALIMETICSALIPAMTRKMATSPSDDFEDGAAGALRRADWRGADEGGCSRREQVRLHG